MHFERFRSPTDLPDLRSCYTNAVNMAARRLQLNRQALTYPLLVVFLLLRSSHRLQRANVHDVQLTRSDSWSSLPF